MTSVQNIIAKYGAYGVSAIGVLVAVLQFFHVATPGLPHLDLATTVAAALGLSGAQAEITSK